MNSLPEGYRALVIGDAGAIGAAFAQALREDPRCASVHGLSRRSDPAIDLENETSLQVAAAALAPQAPWHLVIDATGALTIDGRGPEKHLGALDGAALARSMAVNAIGPVLLLRHLAPQLATAERVIYAKLSARVGSITDNRKGGWYGYRASKAALNMLLHTAAIELHRRRPQLVVAALQPGTVASVLSRPFVAEGEALTPAEAVRGLLAALDGLPAQAGAHFVDYRGQAILW